MNDKTEGFWADMQEEFVHENTMRQWADQMDMERARMEAEARGYLANMLRADIERNPANLINTFPKDAAGHYINTAWDIYNDGLSEITSLTLRLVTEYVSEGNQLEKIGGVFEDLLLDYVMDLDDFKNGR